MSLKCWKLLLLAIAPLAPLSAVAQDNEFPVLNSIGRYFGVGYTRGGYHAALDGRFDMSTNSHPASHYRPGGLPANHAYASPSLSFGASAYAPPQSTLTPAPAVPMPTAMATPKAAEPLPQWLERHRMEGNPKAPEPPYPLAPTDNPTAVDPQSSPSDLPVEKDTTTEARGISHSILESKPQSWPPTSASNLPSNHYMQAPPVQTFPEL